MRAWLTSSDGPWSETHASDLPRPSADAPHAYDVSALITSTPVYDAESTAGESPDGLCPTHTRRMPADSSHCATAPSRGSEVHPSYSSGSCAADCACCCSIILRRVAASGDVIELRCTYDPQRSTKPKGVLHWVAEPKPGTEPLRGGVRLYSELFKTADVSTVDDWLGDLNPESLVEFADVMLSPQLKHAKPLESYQFERVGYFCLDPGSMGTSLVFNRTVTLKETESTQAARK